MIWIIVGILLFLVVLAFALGFLMFRMAFARNTDKQPYFWEQDFVPYRFMSDEDNSLSAEGMKESKKLPWTDIRTEADDGISLFGHIAENPVHRGTVILIHGYRSSGIRDFSTVIPEWFSWGFSILAVDQRGCGRSGGKYITYGCLERYDIVRWANLIAEKWPGLPIVVDGVSMGAATVMMGSGVGYPDQVRVVVADCGYTSPGEICRSVLKSMYHLPVFPVYTCCKIITRILISNIDIENTTCRSALEKSRSSGMKFFIAHGRKDGLVPYWMSEENLKAFRPEDFGDSVTFFTSEEADHGLSLFRNRNEYISSLKELLKRAKV